MPDVSLAIQLLVGTVAGVIAGVYLGVWAIRTPTSGPTTLEPPTRWEDARLVIAVTMIYGAAGFVWTFTGQFGLALMITLVLFIPLATVTEYLRHKASSSRT